MYAKNIRLSVKRDDDDPIARPRLFLFRLFSQLKDIANRDSSITMASQWRADAVILTSIDRGQYLTGRVRRGSSSARETQ